MSRADLLRYCLAKPGAWLDEPWEGDEVVKVADKIFAFFGSPGGSSVGLKCGRNKEDAREWRDQYPADVVVTAYIGRYGWNSFTIGGAVPDDELREAIDLSYADVVGLSLRNVSPAATHSKAVSSDTPQICAHPMADHRDDPCGPRIAVPFTYDDR